MRETVAAMLADGPTAPLEDYLEAEQEDPNLWWRIACGHHQNLLEEAVDRIRELESQLP